MMSGKCEVICLLVAVSSVIRATPLFSGQMSRCHCVPDQWEGRLASSEREFDLYQAKSASSGSSVLIHYDFVNKLLALRDAHRRSGTIVDYRKGYRYVIRGDRCHVIRVEEKMNRMCLPADAVFDGHYTLGDGVPVDIWSFAVQTNVTMKTMVQSDSCIPLLEESFMMSGGYASVTSSLYLDVHPGIEDDLVFSPPGDCVLLTPREAVRDNKRSALMDHVRDLQDNLKTS